MGCAEVHVVYGYANDSLFASLPFSVVVWTELAEWEGNGIDNYLGEQYTPGIKYEGKIYSACEDGKIPFVSTRDVGAVAFHALTDAEAWNKDVRVLGPDLLTIDDVRRPFVPEILAC